MTRYVIKRLLLMIPILVGAIVIVFTINYFSSGSPAMAILGTSATPENIAKVEHEWGLDRPYLVQLGEYLYHVFTKLDLGTSYSLKRPVTELIGERIGITVLLGLLGVAVAVVIGIPLGIVSATRQYSIFDYVSTTFAVILAAIPSFWLALMLMLLFAVQLQWVPVSGLDTWKNWILPVASVGAFPVAMITRMTRSSMLEVVHQDYIRTARAKGLGSGVVIFRHALRNGMIPVTASIGLMTGLAMTGTIIVETIFNIPGLGTLMNASINKYDYTLTQGIVLVCAAIICGTNFITDLVYALIDPRIRAQYSSGKRPPRCRRQESADPATVKCTTSPDMLANPSARNSTTEEQDND